MSIRFLPMVAAVLFVAACNKADDSAQRDQPPMAPSISSANESSGSEKLVTGPKGPSEPLPPVADPGPAGDSGRDSAATQPKSDLSKQEEKAQMPIAGQANTHSSEALSDDKTGGAPGSAPVAASSSGASGSSQPVAAGAAAAGAAGAVAEAGAAGMDGMDLAKKHNCVSCHAVDKKIVGPAYREVAAKYKGDASAEAKLIEKVKKGGSGVWGPIPMPPHPTVPDDQIKAIVDWVLAGAG